MIQKAMWIFWSAWRAPAARVLAQQVICAAATRICKWFWCSPNPDSRLTPEHPDAQIIDGVLPAYDVPESTLSDYLRPDWSDACINVRTEEAYETAHEVLRAEGLFLGTSAAAALHAAVQVGRRPENQGKNIVVIVPDNGMKYLSTPMYRQK